MSGPGFEHERRVVVLRSLAVLSGHLDAVTLYADLRPDVVHVDLNGRRLFLADAKDTETSRRGETRGRLRAYRSASMSWRSAGFTVRFLLCHPDHDAEGWSALLEDLEPGTISARSEWLGQNDRLTWVDLGHVPRRGRISRLVSPAWQISGVG